MQLKHTLQSDWNILSASNLTQKTAAVSSFVKRLTITSNNWNADIIIPTYCIDLRSTATDHRVVHKKNGKL